MAQSSKDNGTPKGNSYMTDIHSKPIQETTLHPYLSNKAHFWCL
jgi:hypothetical protein